MNSTTVDPTDAVRSDRDSARAVYALLAEAWAEPTEERVSGVKRHLLVEGDPLTEAEYPAINAEYSRLFYGPGPEQIPPYESVYRDVPEGEDLGPVLGDSTESVVSRYREFGLGLHEEYPDMPDHISVELEFVSHLLEKNEVDAAQRFIEEHLRAWIDPFVSAVDQQTESAYFETVCDVTREVLATDLT